MAKDISTKDSILSAAESAFSSSGFAGARTEQIAAAAGVNKAMLHYYFETKERLYLAVLEGLLDRFRASVLNPVLQATTPTESLLTFVDCHISFLGDHPGFPPLIQRAMMTGGPHLDFLVENFQKPVSGCLRRIVVEGMERDEFRKVDVDHTLVSLAGLNVFYFIIAPVIGLLLGKDPLVASHIEDRRRSVKDLLYHGLFTRAGRTLADLYENSDRAQPRRPLEEEP